MRDRIAVARLYTSAYTDLASKIVKDTSKRTAKNIEDHQSEILRTAVISSVVYLTSRAAGFKAGYEFANTNQ